MDLFTAGASYSFNPQVHAQLAHHAAVFDKHMSEGTRAQLQAHQQTMSCLSTTLTDDAVERARMQVTHVLSPRMLEQCNSVFQLQTANEITGESILCHSALAQMHKLGQIEAYGMRYQEKKAERIRQRIYSGTTEYVRPDGSVDMTIFAHDAPADDYDNMSALQKQVVRENIQAALSAIHDDEIDPTSSWSGGF